ncbi:hypothetical protein TH61_10685 [Rufibacter sp. DG15C]|uniref:hypothetical protein n=1 Tax=Rufibacter sp. DG15C TaxID=1379909 RepID=UPI00078B256D|nr:hypothetical protein [Rufibacter sp. DG15C]AMM51547.1 hypothetical protein TH61_10685 [Rufibacter sp. DG15C]
MIYKSLDVSGEHKVIGVRNGFYQIELEKKNFKNIKGEDQFHLQFPQDPRIELGLDRPLRYKLLRGGRVNDFMNFCYYIKAIPFMVSEKVVTVLTELSLPDYSLVDVDITNYDSESKFYLLRFPFTELDRVNWPESVIYTGSELLGKNYLNIRSYDDYVDFRQKYHKVTDFEKIVLHNLPAEFDIIWVRGAGIFISPNAEEIFELNKLTGIDIGWKKPQTIEILYP